MNEALGEWLKKEDVSSTLPRTPKLQTLVRALEDFYGEKISAQGDLQGATDSPPPLIAPDFQAWASVSEGTLVKEEPE